ncbi:MAG: bifunctional homocysteine S-methyltransferase/methylenetetrahydrofolate reductase [Holophagales bacterium]|jgi:homocysteine S-methyltransferase|nr:bifunctional homocysteine S-methyltransferase/methylenetetrahydrofolate reductase [Holophagales bacterium]
MSASQTFSDFLLSGRPFLLDGSVSGVLYERGIFINASFDETNISRPDLVLSIHREFLESGAQVINTNTWAANRFKLTGFGLSERLRDINVKGARLARQAISENDLAGSAFVAGCIGPLGQVLAPYGPTSLDSARESFREQTSALLEGGVDLFILESFKDLQETLLALESIKDVSKLPVAALISLDENGLGAFGVRPEWFLAKLRDSGADMVGLSEGQGPASLLDLLPHIKKSVDAPILLRPSAGLPKVIDGRLLYMASPEYLGEFARQALLQGARAVGGCAGVSPVHTRAMRMAIRQENAFQDGMIEQTVSAEKDSVPAIPFAERSGISAKLAKGKFVVSVELVPPKGLNMDLMLQKASQIKKLGADSINIPDGPRAMARLSALTTALLLQQRVGIETVLHYACRDRNLLGIQADLMGAAALDIRNVLAITGDPPKLGPYPKATAVFDVDSIGLVGILRRLNHGLDIGGVAIGSPASFSIGVGANPDAPDREREWTRFRRKVEAGAEWVVTQPVFDVESLFRFLDFAQPLGIPVIAGLWPLKSSRNAQFMATEIPGVTVPQSVLNRMASRASAEDQLNEGMDIAREIMEAARPRIQGLQLSAPFGQVELIAPFIAGQS